MTFAYIGLGGNDIQARKNLARAAILASRIPGARLAAESAAYLSAPRDCPGKQRAFCNGALKLQTTLAPRRMFLHLQKIERSLQKKRRRRNMPRRADVDYLAHGSARLRAAFLTLPHPRMQTRAFVLAPLADVAGTEYEGLPNAKVLRAARKQCAAQPIRKLSPRLQ